MSLGQLILAWVGPWVIQALVAVGFGVTTYYGVKTGFDQLVSYAVANWASLPSDVLQIATLCGVPDGIGLVLGAAVTRISVWASMNAAKLLFKGH